MTRRADVPRVVIVGMGDTGVLTAVGLRKHAEVVAVSTKPEFLSGQELGARVARPELWVRDNRIAFEEFRGLRGVRVVHGAARAVDLDARQISVQCADGDTMTTPYDALVIASGVSNGFWRRPDVQSVEEISEDLEAAHRTLAEAGSVAVVGGGAAAVNAAAHVAGRWPGQRVDLYFPGERALVHHHLNVWERVAARLEGLGVGLHPGHRAEMPDGFLGEAITSQPVRFATGQPDAVADAVLWATGRTRPNTGFIPPELLDEAGFVKVEPTLQTASHPEVFAIGDVAATDPLRGSARNRADRLLVANIRAHLGGTQLAAYRPSRRRWGSVLGIQPDGIEFFAANGTRIPFPPWSVDPILIGWFLYRRTYGGLRRRVSPSSRSVLAP